MEKALRLTKAIDATTRLGWKAKPQIPCSSDPSFRGDAARYNPEELLVASLSSCHMLWYLHLCSVNKITALDYEDSATGVMQEAADGSGAFVNVLLKPTVRISPDSDRSKALALHNEAHHLCFIARSVNFPVVVEAKIVTEDCADECNFEEIQS